MCGRRNIMTSKVCHNAAIAPFQFRFLCTRCRCGVGATSGSAPGSESLDVSVQREERRSFSTGAHGERGRKWLLANAPVGPCALRNANATKRQVLNAKRWYATTTMSNVGDSLHTHLRREKVFASTAASAQSRSSSSSSSSPSPPCLAASQRQRQQQQQQPPVSSMLYYTQHGRGQFNRAPWSPATGRCLRCFHSSSAPHKRATPWQILGFSRPKPKPNAAATAPGLRPANVPSMIDIASDEGNMFNAGRMRAAKTANEQRLRGTEFDENGNVTMVSGEYRKIELITKYGLLPRDLRKIDSSVIPNILVRHSAILISLLHLRVLIKADRVLVFDSYGSADSYTQSIFMYDLESKLQQRESASRTASQSVLSYEFRAFEAVLISVTAALEAEFENLREPVTQILRALEEDVDRDKLRNLLVYSKRLNTFEQKARLVRNAINLLLDADDDLAAMYLTEKKNGIVRSEADHQEVEMLLESYHKICDEIVQASGNLVTNIKNTEEIVQAILDANRNSLMVLDLKFSIGTLGLAFGTLCSSFYGMNLKNFIEESDLGFGVVTGTCFIASGVVCMLAMAKLRKLQRVRMYNETGGSAFDSCAMSGMGAPVNYQSRSMAGRQWSSSSSAAAVDPLWRGLPGETRVERMRRLKHYADRGSGGGHYPEGDWHGEDPIFTPSPTTSTSTPSAAAAAASSSPSSSASPRSS